MQLLATFFYAHKVHYTKLLYNSNYENRLLKLTTISRLIDPKEKAWA